MKKDNGRTARRTQLWRIEEIRKRISQGDYPNCVQMAEEMEVSLKTVKRDIEFMRNELGWPIDYNQTRRGFYFTRSSDKGFGVGLGTDELRDQYVGTPLEKLMHEAFEQLKQNLGLTMTMADTLNGVLRRRAESPSCESPGWSESDERRPGKKVHKMTSPERAKPGSAYYIMANANGLVPALQAGIIF